MELADVFDHILDKPEEAVILSLPTVAGQSMTFIATREVVNSRLARSILVFS
jgi:hypothetical protein